MVLNIINIVCMIDVMFSVYIVVYPAGSHSIYTHQCHIACVTSHHISMLIHASKHHQCCDALIKHANHMTMTTSGQIMS